MRSRSSSSLLSAPSPYSSDALRIAPAAAATALAVLAFMLRSTVTLAPLDTGRLPLRAVGALLGAVLLAAAFADARAAALREVINWILLLSLLVLATSELGGRPARRRVLALTIAAVAAATGLAASLQYAGILPTRFHWGHGVARATAGFGWPNELGMFLALGVPFAAYAVATAVGRWRRLAALAGLGATLAGLAATFSRGSWTAVLLGSIPLLLAGRKGLVLRIWLAAAAALLLANIAAGGEILSRVSSTETDWVVGQRLALTLSGLRMFLEHPLLGVGPGGFGEHLPELAARMTRLWDLTGSAQNGYVQFAAEMGALGLGAFLWFLTAVTTGLLRAARTTGLLPATATVLDPGDDERALRTALLWAVAILWCIGLFEWPFAHGVAELIMVVLALGLARP